MKLLRATLLVAAVVGATLLPASVATAEVHAVSFASPGAGATLTSPTPLEVRVRWSGERPTHVDLRLVEGGGGQVSGTETVRLSDCRGGCEDVDLRQRDATFSGATLRPATLAPFSSGGPRCNGAYGLQARPAGGSWRAGIGIVVSLPPSAPGDVSVTARTGGATISWRPAPQPDVVGYTVQRRTGSSGSWTTVAEVGPQTTEADDTDAPSGSVSYRVTTFRGDGFDGQDQAVPACSDDGRDLATAASPVSTTVPAPSPSPSDGSPDEPTDDGSPTGGGSTGGGSSGGGSSGGGSTGGGGGGDGADGGSTGGGSGGDDDEAGGGAGDQTSASSGDDEPAPSPRPSPRRRAPSATLQSDGSRSSVSVPDVASPSQGERFYGEDGEFSEELDFGELGTTPTGDDEDDDVAGEVSLGVPGGLEGDQEQHLALRRVLAPVAGGMIMLAFGLHLRRWIHAPAE